MAEIHPDIPSSAAQAGFQAREVAKERDARRSARADTAGRQAQSIDEAGRTVETTDDDVAVFADSEGTGSQGRAFEEEKEAESQDMEPLPDQKGITRDEQGHYHVDMDA